MKAQKIAVGAVLCSLFAACGDPQGSNNTNGDPNNTTSTNNTTNTGGTNNTIPPLNNIGGPGGVVLGASADFGTAASAWQYGDLTTFAVQATPFGSGDIGVARGTQWAFVLDRNSAQVQVLEADEGLADLGIIDVSGVATTNPYDATDVGGSAFISLYNAGEIAVATPNGSEWDVSRIDLSSYDDFDQNPEPAAMAADGTYVLVVAQRLQDFVGVEPSLLLVVDTADDSVAEAIDLGGRNAQAGLRPVGSNFAVGVTGDYGANDGGVLEIVRNAEGDYTVGSMLIDEDALGGDLLDFVMVSDTVGYAVVTLPDFSSSLRRFEVGGAVTPVDAVKSPGFGGLDVSANGEWLAVGEREGQTGFVFLKLDEPDTQQPSVRTNLPPAGVRFITL